MISTNAGTIAGMPALNIPFTDDEIDNLRRTAADTGESLRSFAHDAVVDATDQHKKQVRDAAALIAHRSAQLNQRLA